jgi:hypothetical protein
MESKAPVLLLVLVETEQLRWLVASIGLNGQAQPLICSEAGDLEPYRALSFDEQVAFLRHRFCGILQRGCDRLWGRSCKACQIVFLFEKPLPEPTGELTRAVAAHFTEWMLNPPVAVFTCVDGFAARQGHCLQLLAGQLDPAREELLHAHLGQLLAVRDNPDAWELARHKGAWIVQPG